MLIAKIDNGIITVGDYRALFPNTSFPPSGPSAEFMQENGCMGVTVFKAHDSNIQKLASCEPYIENGQVFTVRVESLTQQEIDAATASKAAQIRAERNRRLAECDWTQIADATVDKTAWASYRQALRDITTQTGFPAEVQWPHDPNWIEPLQPV